MGDLASIYPKLAEQVTVGQSTLGQNISGIRISTKVKRSERDLLKPMVIFVDFANVRCGSRIFGKHLEIRFEFIESLIHVGYKKSLLQFFSQPVEDLRTLF